jgi:hypothetical protein
MMHLCFAVFRWAEVLRKSSSLMPMVKNDHEHGSVSVKMQLCFAGHFLPRVTILLSSYCRFCPLASLFISFQPGFHGSGSWVPAKICNNFEDMDPRLGGEEKINQL